MGGNGRRAGCHRRFALVKQCGGPDDASLPIPGAGALQGQRRYGRLVELELPEWRSDAAPWTKRRAGRFEFRTSRRCSNSIEISIVKRRLKFLFPRAGTPKR